MVVTRMQGLGSFASALLLGAGLVGCGAPTPPGNTGGTDVPPGACGRGVVTFSSDYQSTNTSLVDWEGKVLSASLLSSASTAPQLSVPLSGDVVAPTMPAAGDRITIIDRYPGSVLTWVDVKLGQVTAQLSVATGFKANPQDYAEITSKKAYVSRLDPNLAPGMAPFDAGSDVLVVDPSQPAITGRIDLAPAMSGEDPKYYPRPNRIALVDGRAIVLLSSLSLSFMDSLSSRLVTIDTATDAIVSVRVLDGLHGCTGLALSPNGKRVAVSCSGTFANDQMSNIDQSGLAVLARSGDTLTEERRVAAADLGGGPLGFAVSFATDDSVVFTTFGRDASGGAPALDDTVTQVDVTTGHHEVVLRSQGTPFTLGDVRCAGECPVCFATDAGIDGGVLHRFDVEGGALVRGTTVRVDASIGLPPRYLGRF
ncbi:Hypothetical protein A7982_00271 [Minicystis rosea]|nr:Hypothetical protein A7982_00271 [Minicystis rosea]